MQPKETTSALPNPPYLVEPGFLIAQTPDGSIWLGRANGLSRMSDGKTENIPIPPIQGEMPVADVTVAPGEAPGEVWLGTVPSGITLLRDGKIAQPFPYSQAGLEIP